VSALEIEALSTLADDEANFVYNVEILNLPTKKAADLAGMEAHKIYAPHVKQAREVVRAELNSRVNISKDDVVRGMRDAIGRAQILGEPMTEIVGWEKIAKLLGYEAPQKHDVNVTATIEALQGNLKSLPDSELSKLVNASDIIDVEFYVVGSRDQTS
jgi:hypothetical protein